MGTRSVTVIYDGDLDSTPLVKIYCQMDGYFSGHGSILENFLKDIKLVDGISPYEDRNVANGMGCLAAQVIAHLKSGAGGIYITNSTDRQEYNYHIYEKNGKICLIGVKPDGEKKIFLTDFLPDAEKDKIVSFLYPDGSGENRRRLINIKYEDGIYIKGFDVDKYEYRSFLKSRIVGEILSYLKSKDL